VILVLNKNKPDELRDKVFFINADAEYGEGKNQNFLRPEDIEKIDYVFTHKEEVPKYSRLVDLEEIQHRNDWNLNVRSYVDNTPEPEPEDVRAHLIGGVPKAEVSAKSDLLAKFGLKPELAFQERDSDYYNFKPDILGKDALKKAIESAPNLYQTLGKMGTLLSEWWNEAWEDFARLAPTNLEQPVSTSANGSTKKNGSQLPHVRQTLIDSLKDKLIPVQVLDRFQVAGVFVNWWDNIKYDLKTIVQNGWSPTLIPDSYMIEAFFQAEQTEIESLETAIGEQESALAEVVEAAQEVLEYEADEDEKITAALMKKELTAIIKDLKDKLELPLFTGESHAETKAELKRHEDTLTAIATVEKKLKDLKDTLKQKQSELEIKILLKKFGAEDETYESRRLLAQAEKELRELEPEEEAKKDKDKKKKLTALKKDIKRLNERIAAIERLVEDIGGVITDEEAKTLILKKHHNLVFEQLTHYLNGAKRAVVQVFENLWEKYATTARELKTQHEQVSATINDFLMKLNYFGFYNASKI
jgi:type I restriction enzyme M protein